MNKIGSDQDLTSLKEFVEFLKGEKFDIAGKTYLDLLKAADLPLLSFFLKHSPEELLLKASDNLRDFLDDILDDTFSNRHSHKINNWRMNLLSDIPREKIQITDILLINSIRKQLLLLFIPEFSDKSSVATSIMISIERLLINNDKKTFEAYIDIQQQDITEKEEFSSKLIESSINGVWVVNTQGVVLEWNPVMEKEFNISRTKAIGEDIFGLIPFFNESNVGSALKNALKKGIKIITRDSQFPISGGWYDSFISPLYNKNGEIKMILCILHDITIRKQVEIKLQEHKEELQAANEELLEQQEELRKANLELQTNNQQLTTIKNVLKENEARLLEAQSIAHLGIWEYDVPNDKIFWSDEMKKIFGYEVEEYLDYETYLSLLHPEDVDLIKNTVTNTLKTNEPYSFEHRIIRKDGTVRYLMANGRAILSDDNRIIKLQGTGLDITNLKLIESEKNENQYFIQKVTETTPDHITVYDLQLEENIYSNKAFYESLGYSPEEAKLIQNKKIEGLKEILHPEDYEGMIGLFNFFRLYSGNEPKEIECRFRGKNDNWIWIWSTYKVFRRSDKGLPVQLIGISRDITKRKNAEEKILENEARLKESQILAKLGYWEMDLHSDNVYWSEELFRIYGIQKKSYLKLNEIQSYLYPEDQKMLIENIQKAISTGDPYQMRYRISRNSGEIRYISTKGEIITDKDGRKIKIRGVAQDITDRIIVEQKLERAYDDLKRTHEELKSSEEALKVLNNELENRVLNRTEALLESNERLVKINADLDNFIYTASHDLKVPIANIEGLLDILKKRVDDKLQDNDKILLNMMEESVCRFNTTIKDLTQISKIQKDLEEENSERISFSETFNNLLPDIGGLVAEKNSKICTNFEIDEIFFAKKNLRSILYNLIVNSLKYCSENRIPEINISTKRTTEGVMLSISDNGMGIPEKQLGKIFSLFKRYHVNIEGSGIGLYIVKRIIENNGGRVEVKSEVNIGTTFNIIFTHKNAYEHKI